METLVLTLDTLDTLLCWVKYFPKPEIVLNNIGIVGLVEQIYYEVLFARGFVRGHDESKKQGFWKFYKLENN